MATNNHSPARQPLLTEYIPDPRKLGHHGVVHLVLPAVHRFGSHKAQTPTTRARRKRRGGGRGPRAGAERHLGRARAGENRCERQLYRRWYAWLDVLRPRSSHERRTERGGIALWLRYVDVGVEYGREEVRHGHASVSNLCCGDLPVCFAEKDHAVGTRHAKHRRLLAECQRLGFENTPSVGAEVVEFTHGRAVLETRDAGCIPCETGDGVWATISWDQERRILNKDKALVVVTQRAAWGDADGEVRENAPPGVSLGEAGDSLAVGILVAHELAGYAAVWVRGQRDWRPGEGGDVRCSGGQGRGGWDDEVVNLGLRDDNVLRGG